MPQAIKLIDAEGRSCIYVPITQNGKVVDSQGYALDLEDEGSELLLAFQLGVSCVALIFIVFEVS
jgi:hypothetical protein